MENMLKIDGVIREYFSEVFMESDNRKIGYHSDKIECDHIEDGYDYTDEGLVYTQFAYCPNCGEKL